MNQHRTRVGEHSTEDMPGMATELWSFVRETFRTAPWPIKIYLAGLLGLLLAALVVLGLLAWWLTGKVVDL